MDGLVGDLKVYPQTIINVNVRSKPPLEQIAEVSRALSEAHQALADSGRIVLRYSGTELLARVMLEGEEEKKIRAMAEAIADEIRAEIGK